MSAAAEAHEQMEHAEEAEHHHDPQMKRERSQCIEDHPGLFALPQAVLG